MAMLSARVAEALDRAVDHPRFQPVYRSGLALRLVMQWQSKCDVDQVRAGLSRIAQALVNGIQQEALPQVDALLKDMIRDMDLEKGWPWKGHDLGNLLKTMESTTKPVAFDLDPRALGTLALAGVAIARLLPQMGARMITSTDDITSRRAGSDMPTLRSQARQAVTERFIKDFLACTNMTDIYKVDASMRRFAATLPPNLPLAKDLQQMSNIIAKYNPSEAGWELMHPSRPRILD